jgi:fructose-1,6-bisphosphatase/inositol monophosphatase family enzyme
VTAIDPDRVAALIREAARNEIMPRFEKLAAHEVREKARGELVTIADEAVEAWLEPRFIDLLPGSRVLGEEAAAENPSIIAELADSNDPIWMIDPVDGTSNFVAGRPIFAVMVALVRHGEILGGWIYDPVRDRMAVAEHGGGARIDGECVRVATPPAEDRAFRGVILGGNYGLPAINERLKQRRERVDAQKSRRCAGAEYLSLAAGEMHFAVFTRLMPWDHAPGVIIHREAGGYGGHMDGSRYVPGRLEAGALLMAPDKESWERLYRLLLAP